MFYICARFVFVILVASSLELASNDTITNTTRSTATTTIATFNQLAPNDTIANTTISTASTTMTTITTTLDKDIGIIKNLAENNLTDIEPVKGVGLNSDGTINRDIQRELFIGENELIETLNPDQIILKFRKLFRKIDFDKNRLIDTKEMNKWMSRHIKKHYDHAKSKTEQMFQYMDTDKDNQLFWNEYNSVFQKLYPLHLKEHRDHTDHWTLEEEIENMRERWTIFDTDRNEALNFNEFFSFRYPEAAKNTCVETGNELMTVLDTNLDKKISLKEYTYLFDPNSNDPDERRFYRMKKINFYEIDKNNDGFLDIDELINSVDAYGSSLQKKRIDDIFSYVDTNRDKFIDIDEMLDSIRYFVDNFSAIRHTLHDEL